MEESSIRRINSLLKGTGYSLAWGGGEDDWIYLQHKLNKDTNIDISAYRELDPNLIIKDALIHERKAAKEQLQLEFRRVVGL